MWDVVGGRKWQLAHKAIEPQSESASVARAYDVLKRCLEDTMFEPDSGEINLGTAGENRIGTMLDEQKDTHVFCAIGAITLRDDGSSEV